MTHTPGPVPSLDPDRSAPWGAGGRLPHTAAPLADVVLAEEIELYTDVVVAASECDGPLPEGELDRVLGVEGAPAEG